MFGNDKKHDEDNDNKDNANQINEQDAQDLANAVQAISDANTITETRNQPSQDFSPATDNNSVPPTNPPIQSDASADQILAKPIQGAPQNPIGGDLSNIKQTALEQLKPLLDHLDAVPEEKFDAIMMMIRASDEQSLIKPAFEVAQKIADDKKRAEALLDIVNEINYLTSSH